MAALLACRENPVVEKTKLALSPATFLATSTTFFRTEPCTIRACSSIFLPFLSSPSLSLSFFLVPLIYVSPIIYQQHRTLQRNANDNGMTQNNQVCFFKKLYIELFRGFCSFIPLPTVVSFFNFVDLIVFLLLIIPHLILGSN